MGRLLKESWIKGNVMRTLYLNPDRFEKEHSFFETFRSARRDLNIACYRKGKPPEPDYLFSVSQKEIGLEVTTLVLDKSGRDISLAAIRSAQDKCLKKAAEIAEENGLEAINVKVKFRSDDARIDIDYAAKELIDFVVKEISKIDDTKYWNYWESGLTYCSEISIHLRTVNGRNWLSCHRFERIHMNWMRIDPIEEIQSRIDAKQKLYSKYIRSCDECWLLIGVDEWTAPEAVDITEELQDHVFSGAFQRLFFLRNIEGTVTELKIINQ